MPHVSFGQYRIAMKITGKYRLDIVLSSLCYVTIFILVRFQQNDMMLCTGPCQHHDGAFATSIHLLIAVLETVSTSPPDSDTCFVVLKTESRLVGEQDSSSRAPREVNRFVR